MTSLKSRLLPVKEMLVAVLPKKTYHYWRPNLSAPFIIWQEDYEADGSQSDGSKNEQRLHGSIDLYTKTEFDSVADNIQDGLNGISSVSWTYSDVSFEPETNLIHHNWEFWVM